MSVHYDRIYPRRVADVEPTSLLTPGAIAARYIELVDSGTEHGVAFLTVCSEATPPNQVHPAPIVRQVVHQVRADLAALRAVSPLHYETGAAFRDALEAATVLVPVSVWIARLQEAYEVSTFEELRAVLTANKELQR